MWDSRAVLLSPLLPLTALVIAETVAVVVVIRRSTFPCLRSFWVIRFWASKSTGSLTKTHQHHEFETIKQKKPAILRQLNFTSAQQIHCDSHPKRMPTYFLERLSARSFALLFAKTFRTRLPSFDLRVATYGYLRSCLQMSRCGKLMHLQALKFTPLHHVVWHNRITGHENIWKHQYDPLPDVVSAGSNPCSQLTSKPGHFLWFLGAAVWFLISSLAILAFYLSMNVGLWMSVSELEKLLRARDQNGDTGNGSIEVHCVKMSSSCIVRADQVSPVGRLVLYVLYSKMLVFVQRDPISIIWRHALTCDLQLRHSLAPKNARVIGVCNNALVATINSICLCVCMCARLWPTWDDDISASSSLSKSQRRSFFMMPTIRATAMLLGNMRQQKHPDVYIPGTAYGQIFLIIMAFTRNGYFFDHMPYWQFFLTIWPRRPYLPLFACLSYVLFLPEHFVGGCPTPNTV